MKLRKSLRVVASLIALVITAVALLTGYASHQAGRSWDIPYPRVSADRSPAGVARGAVIFHASCESCHKPVDAPRASGARLAEAPAWLGALYASNLTSHPRAGIGNLSDGAIARMIRFAVNHEGRVGQMPSYAMSDADLAAVIGFMRSDDPLFRADPTAAPRSQLSLAGKLALALAGMLSPAERPTTPIQAPAPGPTVAYGRYLSEAVYQCGDCHTPGMDPNKTQQPDAYSGGMEMLDAKGHTLFTPNLTQDEQTGIGRWTRDDFARALREGIRPDGTSLRAPMPPFGGLREEEVEALFVFLRSLPGKKNEVPGRTQGPKSAARLP